jgi:AraC-like DNA-binding protein
MEGSTASFAALWLVQQGPVRLQVGASHVQVMPGEAVLMAPDQPRTIETPHGATWLSVGIQASWEYVDLISLLRLPICWRPAPASADLLPQTMQAMIEVTHRQPETAQLILEGYARAVLGLCWHDLGYGELLGQAHAALPAWLPQAIQQMQQHPEVTVQEMAAFTAYSPAQFRRLFAKYLNMPPQAYLHQVRLRRAQQLLASTDLPVYAIAEQVGYASAAYFTRLFTRRLGRSPQQYRQNYTTLAL